MKRRLFLIYLYLIYLPIGIILTILSALLTVILCFFFEEKNSTYFLRYCWARPLVYLLFCSVKVTGKEYLNKKQSCIFIANHQGVYDVFLLYGWLHTDFRWIMKKELMKIPFVGYACKKVGHISIDRKSRKSAMRSIYEAKRRLIGGTSVVFFPEGTRTRNGQIHAFKRGAFHLAKDLNLPIVPLTIKGVFNIMAGNNMHLHPCQKLELIIHPSISSEEVKLLDIDALCQKGHIIVKNALNEELQ